MQDKRKILVLGASSYVGRHLFDRLTSGAAVGTYRTGAFAGGVFFDSTTMKLQEIVPEPAAFSHAVICLGITNPDLCAAKPDLSHLVNVSSLIAIIDQLSVAGIFPVFLSTEAVFDGRKGDYVETDAVNPILTYGRQKVEVERHIQETCRDYLIIRLARVFGSHRNDGTLFTAWLDKILLSEYIACARDQTMSPVHVDEVSEGIVKLLRLNSKGIFHLANPRAYRRLQILEMLIKAVQMRRSCKPSIQVCNLDDFPSLEKRPRDVSLRPEKFIEATGTRVEPVESWCERIAATLVSPDDGSMSRGTSESRIGRAQFGLGNREKSG